MIREVMHGGETGMKCGAAQRVMQWKCGDAAATMELAAPSNSSASRYCTKHLIRQVAWDTGMYVESREAGDQPHKLRITSARCFTHLQADTHHTPKNRVVSTRISPGST